MSDKAHLNEERTIVQLVLIDETGDSYYRMRWPGKHIAEQAPNWRVISLDARAQERFVWAEEADLLIIYQSNDLDLLPLIERRRKRGKKTLAEYNDNFYAPPPAAPVFEPWSSPLIWQSYERLMEQCDGVVVTGPGLEELFGDKTKTEIHILENHLPDEPTPFEEVWTEPNEEVGIGWAGSIGHISDVIAVIPTIRDAVLQYPQLKLHLMGNDSIPGLLNIPEERYQFTAWGPMAEYYRFWLPVHLGIAPIISTPYNHCRSDIKAVEMASRGVVPILSESLPYRKFIKETKAPKFKNAKELKSIIIDYVRKPDKLKQDAKRCYDYVAEERIGSKREERLALYSKMISGSPSAFGWPVGLGYHEIGGTPKTEMRHAAVLKQVEQALEQKNLDLAQKIVSAAKSENPFVPELALAELKNLRLAKSAELPGKIEEQLEIFPRDLRFLLFKTITRNSDEERIACWSQLAELLSKQEPAFSRFFQNDTVRIFVRHLMRIPDLLQVGEKLLSSLPNSAELRFHLAHAYEKKGEQASALEHFTWIIDARSKSVPNYEFLKNTPLSYLQSWSDGLEARIKGLQLKGLRQKTKRKK